jgi:hypothetical protein
MIVAQWDDGYVLDTDPRREDPLYYYLPRDNWNDSVGIDVEPPYDEAQAKAATIAIFAAHRSRPVVATLEARKPILLRVLPVLIKRFPNCGRFTVRDEFLAAMLPEMNDVFKQANFMPDQAKPDAKEQVWRRRSWLAKLFSR